MMQRRRSVRSGREYYSVGKRGVREVGELSEGEASADQQLLERRDGGVGWEVTGRTGVRDRLNYTSCHNGRR